MIVSPPKPTRMAREIHQKTVKAHRAKVARDLMTEHEKALRRKQAARNKRAAYARNPEKFRQKSRAWRAANPEKLRTARHAYYIRNRARRLAAARKRKQAWKEAAKVKEAA